MQVDAIALQLRPRTMFEACDLGTRLVQANAASVWATWTPLYALVAMVALASGGIAGWLPLLILFWLKPWLDRSLLYVLSRAVFGQPTRWADLWRDRRVVWWQQLASTLTARRLSPWRSYTQPVFQLEGQAWNRARTRRRQILRGKLGAALGMHGAYAQLESILVFAALLLIGWVVGNGQGSPLAAYDGLGDGNEWFVVSSLYAAVVLLLEPFYVGAGFAMYLNRRVELEAWDIEQEFRLAFAR